MKASKKLITASCALVAALAVSVGSTFAWFTTSEYVTISGISANVTTTESDIEVRQVRSDGTVVRPWSDGLSLDLTKETDHFEFDALSSIDKGLHLYNRENFANAASDSSYTKAVKPNGKQGAEADDVRDVNKGFLEIYLEFRTTKDGLSLLLNVGSTVTAIDGMRESIYGWEGMLDGEAPEEPSDAEPTPKSADYYGTKVAEDDLITASAADAMRVGFYTYDTYTEDATVNESAEGLKVYGVWAPNEAALSGNQTDGKLTTTGTNISNNTAGLADRGRGYWKNNLASDYEGHLLESGMHGDESIKNSSDIEGLYAQPDYKGIQEDYTTIVTLEDDFEDFEANYAEAATDDGEDFSYAKICIRVWVEGTDGDCFNNIFNDTVRITLLFKQTDDGTVVSPGAYDMEKLAKSVATKNPTEDSTDGDGQKEEVENGNGVGG